MSEERYTRKEVEAVIKWLEDAPHQMANACEMLGDTLIGSAAHKGTREAQKIDWNAYRVIEALRERYGIEA